MKKFSVYSVAAFGLLGNPLIAQADPATPMSLMLTSPAFAQNASIPARYTCDGANVSPALQWNRPPEATRSLTIIVEDPDAPGRTLTHWVLFNLPPGLTQLDSAIPASDKMPNGGVQGQNDLNKLGYSGPCPPNGSHRYFFRVYAVDRQLELTSSATKTDVMQAMEGHILAQGELVGMYKRIQ